MKEELGAVFIKSELQNNNILKEYEMDKKQKKEKIVMKSVANESILMFFNDYLYKNNLLSDEEREKMAVSIALNADAYGSAKRDILHQ